MNKIVTFLHSIANRVPVVGKFFTEEFIRFVFIGGSSFIIFYTLNNLFILILEHLIGSSNDQQRAIIVSGSYITAYFIAFLYNFALSRQWTFQQGKANATQVRTEAFKFLFINILNALGGAIFVTILDYFGIPPFVSQPFFIAVQMVWTYFLYKYWVFNHKL